MRRLRLYGAVITFNKHFIYRFATYTALLQPNNTLLHQKRLFLFWVVMKRALISGVDNQILYTVVPVFQNLLFAPRFFNSNHPTVTPTTVPNFIASLLNTANG